MLISKQPWINQTNEGPSQLPKLSVRTQSAQKTEHMGSTRSALLGVLGQCNFVVSRAAQRQPRHRREVICMHTTQMITASWAIVISTTNTHLHEARPAELSGAGLCQGIPQALSYVLLGYSHLSTGALRAAVVRNGPAAVLVADVAAPAIVVRDGAAAALLPQRRPQP